MITVSITLGSLFFMRTQAATHFTYCHNTAHCSNVSNALTTTDETNAVSWQNLFASEIISLPTMLTCGAYIAIVLYMNVTSLYKNRLIKPWIPDNQSKTYSLYLKVSRGCSLVNKTIVESGLSNLNAILVAHIKAPALTSDVTFGILDAGGVIEEEDILVFMSEIEMLPELMRFQGLVFTSLQVCLIHCFHSDTAFPGASPSTSSPDFCDSGRTDLPRKTTARLSHSVRAR
jgi:hypothetical protein